MFDIKHCLLCPRRCGADRTLSHGLCGGGSNIKVARAAPHFWEEPCISGTNGSGAIFFGGCTLGCSFCQNREISGGGFGAEISAERFAEICFELRDKGVHNINLVTADHFVPMIAPVLADIRGRLGLPVVFNCSGWETPEMLAMLDGLIDIYLPDFKFFDGGLSLKYCRAGNYSDVAMKAIRIMAESTGKPLIENGIMKRGTMVRHLVIPGCRRDSEAVIKALGESFEADAIMISLMSQYTPNGSAGTPSRRITSFEYECVAKVAEKYGFCGYLQEKSSAKEEYTPPFDLEGVTK